MHDFILSTSRVGKPPLGSTCRTQERARFQRKAVLIVRAMWTNGMIAPMLRRSLESLYLRRPWKPDDKSIEVLSATMVLTAQSKEEDELIASC